MEYQGKGIDYHVNEFKITMNPKHKNAETCRSELSIMQVSDDVSVSASGDNLLVERVARDGGAPGQSGLL